MTRGMRRRCFVPLLALAMSLPPALPPALISPGAGRAVAQASDPLADPSAKEAFEAARQLGTLEAWQAFLTRYRTGFYADLARAYVKRLTDAGAGTPGAPATPGTAAPPAAAEAPPPAAPSRPPPPPAVAAPLPAPPPATPSASRPPPPPAAPPPAALPPAETPAATQDAGVPPTDPAKPAIGRGARYMGFPERFNRYYTDPSWRPLRTIFVAPDGRGDGSSRQSPASVQAGIAAARPGTLVHFNAGTYRVCVELTREQSGTYDQPVVLLAERKADGTRGVSVQCCNGGRQSCFNLEAADHVAIDGFEMIGGRYGVRMVGAGYAASEHAQGNAVIDCEGHGQDRDPFFSGQADWVVWERNRGHGAGPGDGHGLYISNGSDWNIVRFNETFNNPRSDFQVNADPASTCREVGIPFADPRCDAYAGEGEGGQGASDYFLIDSNAFHHNPGPGVNFTSLRRSLIRNNVFGFNTRHNVSFWQETDNPKLGSRENRILHNLFVSTGRHGVQFANHSTRNEFANNVVIGIQPNGTAANPQAVLVEADGTVRENVHRDNLYASGRFEGYRPNDREIVVREFSPAWFARFPTAPGRDPNDLRPSAGAPFLARGARSPFAPTDRNGIARTEPADLGPIAAGGPAATTPPPPSPAPAAPAAPVRGTPPPPPPAAPSGRSSSDAPAGGVPRAVTVARATAIPACAIFVDASAAAGGGGTAQAPHRTIAAAVAAARPGAVICVSEGTYPEQIRPGEKHLTLAGGFQRGSGFRVRDSAAFVSKAQGRGGSFLRVEDPAPKGDALTAIDGFEITGYAQAIVRDFYEPQRFDITNNHIHDNTCTDQKHAGAAFALQNVSGTIAGNVIRRNACGRGGGGSVYDDVNKNMVLVANNLVEQNSGTEPDASHGGGLYLFANRLTVTGNLFVGNSVTQWGGGLYVGAWTAGGKFTNARMSWNVYRGNRAGNSGAGFFCDDAATCHSEHEVYVGNCGGNVLLDGGEDTSGPNVASFDHITNVGALEPDCRTPGIGVLVTKGTRPPATYTFTNALFWGNAPGKDFATYCDAHCANAKVTVSHSMVQTEHARQNMAATFGPGIVAPADPLFVDAARGDFHLQSAAGQWSPAGHAGGSASSPALGRGTGPSDRNPERAGRANELGAYGNSPEAAFTR